MARPRIHPTASARLAASRAALQESGGSRREFLLSAEATSALAKIRARDGDATDKAVIERLLIDAARSGR